MQNRFKRCIYRSSYPSRIQKVPHFQKRRKSLSIPFSSIRAKRSSPFILQTDDVCNRTVTTSRDSHGILSGRHMSPVKFKRRSHENNSKGQQSSECLKLHHQRRKEYIDTLSNTGISGFPVQHEEDEDYSTYSQDQQSSTEDQASSATNGKILQMDCKSTGEGYVNDPGDRRSITPHPSSPTRLDQELIFEQQELGETLPDFSSQSTRISMVEELNNNKEWPTNPNYEVTNFTNNHIHRQLGLGLGGELTNDGNFWFLEQDGTINVNKRSRIESSIFCFEDACPKIRKPHNQGFHRQHYDAEVYDQVWWNSLPTATRTSSDDTRSLQQVPLEGDLSTYSRNQEHKCGQTLKETSTTLRTDNSEKDVPNDFKTMGSDEDRCICSSAQPPAKEILESTSKSDDRSPTCIASKMVKEGYVPKSSVETDSTGVTTDQSTEAPTSSSSDTVLAQSILVPNDIEDETSGQSNYNEDKQEILPRRMDIINEEGASLV